MPQYLISFDEGAMTFPDAELPEVGRAAHAVIQEAMDAGVWVFCGGVTESSEANIVETDGTVTGVTTPDDKQWMGGLTIIDVNSREEALDWAAKIATACRCAQEVREIMPDPSAYRGPARAASASSST